MFVAPGSLRGCTTSDPAILKGVTGSIFSSSISGSADLVTLRFAAKAP